MWLYVYAFHICRWRDVILCVWLLQVKMWLYVYDYCRWRCDYVCMINAGKDVIVCVWLLQVKMWLCVYDYCRWRCDCMCMTIAGEDVDVWNCLPEIFFIFAHSRLVLWYMFRLSYNKRDIYRTLSLELSYRTVYGYLIVQSLIIWVFQLS